MRSLFSSTFRFLAVSAMLPFAVSAATQAQSMAPSPSANSMTGFGAAIAIGEGEILVSRSGTSPFIPLKSDRAGGVHIFQPDGNGGWQEVGQFAASDAMVGDHFGSAMALEQGTLAVVGPEANDGEGAVYLFEKGDEGWTETGRVIATSPGDSTPAEAFGGAVAVSGGTLFVGAPRQASAAGAVYVFTRNDDGAWEQSGMLTGVDTQARDRFGSALAFDGTDLLVSAPRANKRRGRVYLFRWDTDAGSWTEISQMNSAADKPIRFGSALSLSHGLLAIAPGSRANQEGIALFVRNDAGDWSAAGSLVPDSTATGTFGRAIAVAGADAWVGEPSFEQHGRVHHFARGDDGTWTVVEVLSPEGMGPNAFFGGSVVATADLAVIGALGADMAQGSGHVYARSADGWTSQGSIVDLPASMAAMIGEQVRCDEEGSAGVFGCSDVDVLAFIPTADLGADRGVFVNDTWGWTDPGTGREFAIVGRVDGTVFLEVTDPTNPIFVGELPMHEGSRANFWRDMKVYDNHTFIVADGAGEHGMQVFDLRQLLSVTETPATFEETAHYDGIASSHNIVINEDAGYAYAVGASGGAETCGGAFHMIDIREPANPTFAGCFGDTNAGRRSTGYTHDAQCVNYHGPDPDYQGKEICFGASETALTVADVSDKDNPIAIAAASYPNVGYAHQGWLTDDHKYFYLNDELDELSQEMEGTRTLVWDLTDLDDPIMVKEHFGTTGASDHNLYVQGDFMYQSNYVAGLQILDISDPENPRQVGSFDTVPQGDNEAGFGGSWSNYPYFESGTIVVTSSREGVFLLKKRPTDLTP